MCALEGSYTCSQALKRSNGGSLTVYSTCTSLRICTLRTFFSIRGLRVQYYLISKQSTRVLYSLLDFLLIC
jgi:hypothetical protein